MSDYELVKIFKLMHDIERNEASNSLVLEHNIKIMEDIFANISEDADMKDIGANMADLVSKMGSKLGKLAKHGLSKISDKLLTKGYESAIAKDVLRSYKDELLVIKEKHQKLLTLYSKEFWEDIFDMLGVNDSNIKDDFLKIHKSNLIDLKNDNLALRTKVLDIIKNIKFTENDKTINLYTRYKTLPAILTSKYKDLVLDNNEYKMAINTYIKETNTMYKTRFMEYMAMLIQAMTIDYISKKNAKLKSNPPNAKLKSDTQIKESFCRFELFEEQYLILNEDQGI